MNNDSIYEFKRRVRQKIYKEISATRKTGTKLRAERDMSFRVAGLRDALTIINNTHLPARFSQ